MAAMPMLIKFNSDLKITIESFARVAAARKQHKRQSKAEYSLPQIVA